MQDQHGAKIGRNDVYFDEGDPWPSISVRWANFSQSSSSKLAIMLHKVRNTSATSFVSPIFQAASLAFCAPSVPRTRAD